MALENLALRQQLSVFKRHCQLLPEGEILESQFLDPSRVNENPKD
jgi:hypothetical protein